MKKSTLPAPPRPASELAGLLYDLFVASRQTENRRENPFADARYTILDGLADLSDKDPVIADNCRHMSHVLQLALNGSLTDEQILDFKSRYETMNVRAHPTTNDFLKQRHNLIGYSSSHSLNQFDLNKLREMDRAAYSDPALKDILKGLSKTLKEVKQISDVASYARAFEQYSEARVYVALKNRIPSIVRIDEKDGKVGSVPDFKCTWNDKVFYVEVKTFDVVEGLHRNIEIMDSFLDAEVSLDEQARNKKQISTAVTEISPYKKYGDDKEYDPCGLIRVIDTLIKKSRTAFKQPQFSHGPTFALAVLDRLVIPGNQFSLAPYYYDEFQSSIISGVLWQMCFGKIGSPIFRANFEGGETLEGYMGETGLYVDDSRTFPGVGFLALNDNMILGLFDPEKNFNNEWTADDTKDLYTELCTQHNDKFNSRAFLLSRYQI